MLLLERASQGLQDARHVCELAPHRGSKHHLNDGNSHPCPACAYGEARSDKPQDKPQDSFRQHSCGHNVEHVEHNPVQHSRVRPGGPTLRRHAPKQRQC